MQPTCGDLLHSARLSLRSVVVPALDDAWARYVATAVGLILEHVELRLADELTLLRADTEELATLLDEADAVLAAHEAEPDVAPVRAAVAAARTGIEQSGAGDLAAATQRNEVQRAAACALIRGLDALEAGPAQDWALPLHDKVRVVVRNEVARHARLTRPTFMTFGPATTGADR